MRSDCASSPTLGSRFAGLDSMIMTRVSGFGLRAHEVAHEVKTSAKITRDHVGTGVHARAFVPLGRNFAKFIPDGRACAPAATFSSGTEWTLALPVVIRLPSPSH